MGMQGAWRPCATSTALDPQQPDSKSVAATQCGSASRLEQVGETGLHTGGSAHARAGSCSGRRCGITRAAASWAAGVLMQLREPDLLEQPSQRNA